MSEKKGWCIWEITPDSSEEILQEHFRKKPDTYRARGKLGDKVRAQTLFGEVEGIVIEQDERYRQILAGKTLCSQTWVRDKYWMDTGAGPASSVLLSSAIKLITDLSEEV